jgi:prepilin-type N-terminal cleavage/methylation domain-containing protein
MRKNNKGFTLIELMIVVVIIGILAALAIPRFMEASKKAKISEARNVLKQCYVQAAAYYEEKGAWPKLDITGDPTNGWLNNGWARIGIDAPSGKPRFAYKWVNTNSAAPPGTVLAIAYGAAQSGCPNQWVDASLVNIQLRVDNSGNIQLSTNGGTSWE